MGLRNNPWKIAPARAKPPPTKNAERTRGRRRSKTISLSVADISRSEIGTGPMLKPIRMTANRAAAMIKQRKISRFTWVPLSAVERLLLGETGNYEVLPDHR